MKRSQAEELYGRLEQVPDLIRPRIKAALEIALGTVPDSPSDLELELLTPQEAERFRWQREPLQGRNQ